MTASDITARITAALADLGETPDEVADQLRAKDIKGHRRMADACPVANYLRTTVDPRGEYEITDAVAYVNNEACPVPAAVGTFVKRFDRGVYLDLVAVP